MAHVLGYVAEANEEELEKDPPACPCSDSVGKQGLEYALEDRLRGSQGPQTGRGGRVRPPAQRTDPGAARGRQRTSSWPSTWAISRRACTQLMGGEAGAIVVMEPDTGKILALVSQPSYDNNMFVLGVPADKWKELRDNPRHPIQNRVTQGVYPPGSVFKLLMAAAGLSEGFIRPGKTWWAAPGSYKVGNRDFHDWKKGGHGTLDLRGALVHSCDIYFYKLGEKHGHRPPPRVRHGQRLRHAHRHRPAPRKRRPHPFQGVEAQALRRGLVPAAKPSSPPSARATS